MGTNLRGVRPSKEHKKKGLQAALLPEAPFSWYFSSRSAPRFFGAERDGMVGVRNLGY